MDGLKWRRIRQEKRLRSRDACSIADEKERLNKGRAAPWLKLNKSGPTMAKRARGRGRPKFVPTTDQRRFVSVLVGMGVSQREIAHVIHHQGTDKPIGEDTLRKWFHEDIARGGAHIRATIISKWYTALMAGEQWAINFGLRHRCGFRDDVTVAIDDGDNDRLNAEDCGIRVTFVRSRERVREEQEKLLGPKLIENPTLAPLPDPED